MLAIIWWTLLTYTTIQPRWYWTCLTNLCMATNHSLNINGRSSKLAVPLSKIISSLPSGLGTIFLGRFKASICSPPWNQPLQPRANLLSIPYCSGDATGPHQSSPSSRSTKQRQPNDKPGYATSTQQRMTISCDQSWVWNQPANRPTCSSFHSLLFAFWPWIISFFNKTSSEQDPCASPKTKETGSVQLSSSKELILTNQVASFAYY